MPCARCGAAASARCAGCRRVAYCSTECQRSDWQTHRAVCNRLTVPPRERFDAFLRWAGAQVGEPVTDAQFFLRTRTVEAVERHRTLEDGIVDMAIRDLLRACLEGTVLHMDCALTVVALKCFRNDMQADSRVKFLWPLAYGAPGAAEVAVVTSMTEDPTSELRCGEGKTLFAVQWIFPMSATVFWGMTTTGLRAGPKSAWGAKMVRVHSRLKVSRDAARDVLLNNHYPPGACNKVILDAHAALLHTYACTVPAVKAVYLQ